MQKGSKWITTWRTLAGVRAGRATAGKDSLRKLLRNDDGAALVETAISTIIVLGLLFAVFDFSLAFYTFHYVSDAAREGARYAIVRGNLACSNTPNIDVCKAGDTTGATEADISAYVAGCNASTSSGASVCGSNSYSGLAYPGIDNADYMKVKVSTASLTPGTLTWTSCGEGTSCNSPGAQVQVQVTYKFPLSVPFWRQESIGIGSTSTMTFSQ